MSAPQNDPEPPRREVNWPMVAFFAVVSVLLLVGSTGDSASDAVASVAAIAVGAVTVWLAYRYLRWLFTRPRR